MKPGDELQAMLRRLAEADAPQVLEEARAAARRRVSALLEEEMADALLEAFGSPGRTPGGPAAGRNSPARAPGAQRAQAEPAPIREPEAGDGWWTYCVLRADNVGEIAAGLGGLEQAPVEAVVEGELAALVSRVPLADYGDEQLREHLEDIAWLERTARGHEAILEAALEQASIVPLRLCTLYRDLDGVRRLLREQQSTLSHNLTAVEGCLEWGVKVFVDHETAARAASAEAVSAQDAATGARSLGPGASAGADYLAARQRERELAGQLDALCNRCGEEVEAALRPLSRADRNNPPQRPEAHGREAEMIINAVYLVERSRRPELEIALDELRSRWEPRGLTVELTGPWPPYNFVADSAGVLG